MDKQILVAINCWYYVEIICTMLWCNNSIVVRLCRYTIGRLATKRARRSTTSISSILYVSMYIVMNIIYVHTYMLTKGWPFYTFKDGKGLSTQTLYICTRIEAWHHGREQQRPASEKLAFQGRPPLCVTLNWIFCLIQPVD